MTLHFKKRLKTQVAGGLIAGEDTESFLDEVDRVQEVADIDAMTDTEEEESFESEWSEPTLDIGYDKPQPTIEEMDGVEKVDLSRRERVLLVMPLTLLEKNLQTECLLKEKTLNHSQNRKT